MCRIGCVWKTPFHESGHICIRMYNRDLYSLVKRQYFIIFTFRQVLPIYSHIHYHKANNIPYIANRLRWKSFADIQAIFNSLKNFCGLPNILILKRKYAHVHKQLSQVAIYM